MQSHFSTFFNMFKHNSWDTRTRLYFCFFFFLVLLTLVRSSHHDGISQNTIEHDPKNEQEDANRVDQSTELPASKEKNQKSSGSVEETTKKLNKLDKPTKKTSELSPMKLEEKNKRSNKKQLSPVPTDDRRNSFPKRTLKKAHHDDKDTTMNPRHSRKKLELEIKYILKMIKAQRGKRKLKKIASQLSLPLTKEEDKPMMRSTFQVETQIQTPNSQYEQMTIKQLQELLQKEKDHYINILQENDQKITIIIPEEKKDQVTIIPIPASHTELSTTTTTTTEQPPPPVIPETLDTLMPELVFQREKRARQKKGRSSSIKDPRMSLDFETQMERGETRPSKRPKKISVHTFINQMLDKLVAQHQRKNEEKTEQAVVEKVAAEKPINSTVELRATLNIETKPEEKSKHKGHHRKSGKHNKNSKKHRKLKKLIESACPDVKRKKLMDKITTDLDEALLETVKLLKKTVDECQAENWKKHTRSHRPKRNNNLPMSQAYLKDFEYRIRVPLMEMLHELSSTLPVVY